MAPTLIFKTAVTRKTNKIKTTSDGPINLKGDTVFRAIKVFRMQVAVYDVPWKVKKSHYVYRSVAPSTTMPCNNCVCVLKKLARTDLLYSDCKITVKIITALKFIVVLIRVYPCYVFGCLLMY